MRLQVPGIAWLSKQASLSSRWLQLAAACVAAGLLLLRLGFGSLGRRSQSQVYRVGIVIDAGSSGSRAHVYTWQRAAPLDTLAEAWAGKQWPGLGAAAEAPRVLRNARRDAEALLARAEAACAAAGLACDRAPVFLRATAGLRLVAAPARQLILDGVAAAIAASPFRAGAPPRTVRGSEEAAYDWLTVSAAARTLLPRGAALAALDLGGASTQIAFELPDDCDGEDDAAVRLPPHLGRGRQLYAVSRLGLGMNEAFKSVVAREGGAACVLPGDFEACLRATSAFVRRSEAEGTTGLGRSPRPPPLPATATLVALDNYYHAVVLVLWGGDPGAAPRGDAAGLPSALSALPAPSIAEIEAAARPVCALSLEQHVERVGHAVPTVKLEKACLAAALTVVLLREVYGCDDSRRIHCASEIRGFDGSWALGSMVWEMGKMT